GWYLHLSAARSSRNPKGRANRPRGDGPSRGPGIAYASCFASRTLERNWSVGVLRQRVGAVQRPARARFLLGPDSPGDHHRSLSPGGPVLATAPLEFLSNSDEVPRRDPPSVRPDAWPRIYHEGRLQF